MSYLELPNIEKFEHLEIRARLTRSVKSKLTAFGEYVTKLLQIQ